jgi:MmyB-like transcription regulator ligand binding domain
MVLRLAEHLEIPLRERNGLLLAAGFAPQYVERLTDAVAPELVAPPANALRATLHPEGMAPRILSLPEWSAHLLHRLRRQTALTADPELERRRARTDDGGAVAA